LAWELTLSFGKKGFNHREKLEPWNGLRNHPLKTKVPNPKSVVKRLKEEEVKRRNFVNA